MKPKSKIFSYLSQGFSFRSQQAAQWKMIYAPLCGVDAQSLKSAITPFLAGDSKVDKHHFFSKPTSSEDLREPGRNFFVSIKGKLISFYDEVDDKNAFVEVGPLWHRLVKKFPSVGIELQSLNFIPVSGETVEIMQITVKNISRKKVFLSATSAIPIFGRDLANKHDHEHVTSLLHRIKQNAFGVCVEPSMKFNEEGHKANEKVYFVYGVDEAGIRSTGSFPTVESFCGLGGDLSKPQALIENRKPRKLAANWLDGKEAMGALSFGDATLNPGDSKEYIVVFGMAKSTEESLSDFKKFNTLAKIEKAFETNTHYWQHKAHSITFGTGSDEYNAWLHWVTLQPVFRRIFGCSFLPDHDYGKGGKGWRDIWQDLLSLILIEPQSVRDVLVNNFAGVRIDGSNATIVGTHPGEFIADRNAITRVWMDHGVWPFLTTMLYVHQTGDIDLLLEKNSYFRDMQQSRAHVKDPIWSMEYGKKLKSVKGDVYSGTLLEHILVQHLTQFFNVGEHNLIRLENADWNDGLDMAYKRGESVAFTSLYGGNILAIADLLDSLREKYGWKEIVVLKELKVLFDTIANKIDYNDPSAKNKLLFDVYYKSVQPEISGATVNLNIVDCINDLRRKGQWIFEHIRRQEKVTVDGMTWFNGYYDNRAERVEGKKNGRVRMTLTGQVFPIMSGVATEEDTANVIASVRKYLKDKKLGGFRLNTDFGLKHYLDFGRAFGFAYGTKENGAFFSHMIVMYAFGLYKQGFVREGREVLQSIYNMCMDTDKSRIYPGIPEYFDSNGKGMYHYLTGSASWWVLTELTQVFGVRGEFGHLVISPKLVKDQFSKKGVAEVSCHFAGHRLHVVYQNQKRLDYNDYQILEVLVNGKAIDVVRVAEDTIVIPRENFLHWPENVTIEVVLD